MDEELRAYIVKCVKKYYQDQSVKIFLYGSRARGDNSERSDWDLAVESDKEISGFMLDLKDGSPTLCGIDIVFLPNATEELKNVIANEGKIIYEQ